MKKEKWRDIPGTEGRYMIDISTKEGRCINIITGHILANYVHKRDKRIFWTLRIGGKNITKQAARWIAETYPELITNTYFDGAEIDHINTDRLDNRPENLRWVTRKDNLNNPITLNNKKGILKGKPNKKLSKPVKQYTLEGELIAIYPSVAEAQKQTGFYHISEYCSGVYKCKYYRWSY